jgi:hypothetical protein
MAGPAATILEAARAYAGRGWSVVPVAPRGKRPLVAWREFQTRRAGPDEIAEWFARWPDANIAIVTGAISGIVVLDIDPAHGGAEAIARFAAEHGPLPATVECLTGGGGRHLYFAHPGRPILNKAGLVPGVDLRGDGGLVVAPPSLHPSGRRYAWMPGHAPEECGLAALGPSLLHLVAATPAATGHPTQFWIDLLRRGVDEGQRNNTMASLAGHLLWREVDPDVVLELLLCWNRVRCHPPLPDGEVAAVVHSITRLHRGAS